MRERPLPKDEHGWPPKAYKNVDFLNSSAARKIRVLCELTEPEERFARERVEDTIVMFGSARTLPLAEAEQRLHELEAELEGKRELTPEEAEALQVAQSRVRMAPYYEASRKLACRLTEWSKELHDKHHRFLVCSGGGPGIMEAANLGARDANGASLGLGISLPHEQGLNPYVTRSLSFEFHYFFIRKYWFMYLAKALVAFPGGFGTLDELFEVLTLVQTGKVHKKVPVVLFGSAFWNQIVNFDALADWGVISRHDLNLFKVCDDVDEAFDYITNWLTREWLTEK
ncbi:MAG: TIGR00730 family Rossman fold protein [Verrucomicrobiota bacterium JB022]|nr:TIGR00730 family Rossman fold protein [Verrucomicrobiota bacterium JB022]